MRKQINWEFLLGVFRPVLQILTLFQTKKCNFPHPFSDKTSEIHACFPPALKAEIMSQSYSD